MNIWPKFENQESFLEESTQTIYEYQARTLDSVYIYSIIVVSLPNYVPMTKPNKKFSISKSIILCNV